jgi:thymidylate synthase (FAD)
VSFGKKKEIIDASDHKLIEYLIKNKHYSPFRHAMMQFHIKAPEFVMRQFYKHVVGCEWTSSYPTKDHAWNELSLRYVEVADYYEPCEWRKQSEDNKQASDGLVDKQMESNLLYNKAMSHMLSAYKNLLALGVAKEQARIILPLSIYTEVYWTASFQAIMNFIELRRSSHAQLEIRKYAEVLENIMKDYFPVSTELWLKHNQ